MNASVFLSPVLFSIHPHLLQSYHMISYLIKSHIITLSYFILFLTSCYLMLSMTSSTQRPARPLLSSGPVSYPMNRPIAAIWESDTVPSSSASARPSGQSGKTATQSYTNFSIHLE